MEIEGFEEIVPFEFYSRERKTEVGEVSLYDCFLLKVFRNPLEREIVDLILRAEKNPSILPENRVGGSLKEALDTAKGEGISFDKMDLSGLIDSTPVPRDSEPEGGRFMLHLKYALLLNYHYLSMRDALPEDTDEKIALVENCMDKNGLLDFSIKIRSNNFRFCSLETIRADQIHKGIHLYSSVDDFFAALYGNGRDARKLLTPRKKEDVLFSASLATVNIVLARHLNGEFKPKPEEQPDKNYVM